MKSQHGDLNFDDQGDADRRAEMLDSHPEGSQRNWREDGLGVSKVTARRELSTRKQASVVGRSGRIKVLLSQLRYLQWTS